MAQKVLRVGSSLAATIPKDTVRVFGLHAGDMINVSHDEEHGGILITPTLNIDTKLVEWTKNFIDRYRPALEKLAKK